MKKIDEPRVKMQVSVHPDLLFKLKKIALERGKNLRELVIEALDNVVNNANF